MPIETLQFDDPKYQNYLRSFSQQDWTLCIGAGVCKGILPDWNDLTHRLVNKCFSRSWTLAEFEEASKEVGFSLDSWIQGCANKVVSEGKTIDDFYNILEFELYDPLLQKADSIGIKNDLIKIFESPKGLKKASLFKVCDFFEQEYGHTTLMQLVNVLLSDSESYKLPSSIVTFNADSLLHSLLVIFNIKRESEKKGELYLPKEPFRKVTRTYQHWAQSIPIFHLHGSLSPQSSEIRTNGDARDSLIFLESSYSEVASSMNSWAQTNFLYLAQHTKMVFLGLSMSDPNIRRWMSWVNDSYISQLSELRQEHTISLNHLWIRTESNKKDIQEFLDVSLRHLGVKIAILKGWSEVEKTLKKIM